MFRALPRMTGSTKSSYLAPPDRMHQVEADSDLTGAQITCLEGFGIELGATPLGDSISIPQNVADECLLEADDSDGAPP